MSGFESDHTTHAHASPSAPQVLECDHSSITLIWEAQDAPAGSVGGIVTYELQISECVDLSQARSEDAWSLYKTLSATISTNSAKKKNLIHSAGYRFRVRSKLTINGSITQSEFSACATNPPYFQTLAVNTIVVDPPSVVAKDGESVTLKWCDKVDSSNGVPVNVVGAKLRFRSEHEIGWSDIGGGKVVNGVQVRKKGLVPGTGYYFSVLPVLQEGSAEETVSWSPSTAAVFVSSFDANMARLMPPQLLTKNGLVNTKDVLSDKTVLIYFSAHWCGPCRQCTPQLAELYKQGKSGPLSDKFEIVFCSADHEETEFDGYFAEHPWIAIPYDWEYRERLMGAFSVKGIPQLTVMDKTTRILEQNATQSLSMQKLQQWTAGTASPSPAPQDHGHSHSHGHAHEHQHGPGCKH